MNRKGIASQRNQIGEIANSNLGGFIQNLLNAQYSQQEEREADDNGIWFLKNGGHDVIGSLGGQPANYVAGVPVAGTRSGI
jgi:predicted Zn-dependent protease